MLIAELIKLKRAQLWVVIIVLPILAVVTGTVNTTANAGVVTQSWDGLMSQITLFYGLFFCAIGVAIIVAAGWRMEHSGTNWIQVRTTTPHYLRFVLAKIIALLVPVAGMSLMLLVGAFIGGKLAMGLPGLPSPTMLSATALTVIVAAPLVALQSVFSIWMRSFAAPVGVASLGCILGIGVSMAAPEFASFTPYSLLSEGILMGSLAVGDSEVSAANVIRMLIATAVMTGAFTATGAMCLRWRLSKAA